VLGIAGPSCSGKSELAGELARVLGAPVLALDHFYRDLPHLSLEERARVNFDHPDALDAQLIAATLRQFRAGQAVSAPRYDFAQHRRADVTDDYPASPLLIAEGLLTLHWPEVRELLDGSVFVRTPDEVCYERRLFRDTRERGRTPESVEWQYQTTVRPMCQQFILPTEPFADVVVDGTAPLTESAALVVQALPWLNAR
jgi:uridine kinase